MPVQKFRDFETARRALWLPSGHPDIARKLRRLWPFSQRLARHQIPRGVHKFHSIEEANRARQRWETHLIGRRGSLSEKPADTGEYL